MNSCLGVCPNSLICSSMAARSSGSRILVEEREGERVGWRREREGGEEGEGRTCCLPVMLDSSFICEVVKNCKKTGQK